ncbi:MAG TPA: redoxin domain-containing protein [Thermomicrobiales bacterium]|nr:redoxin domain-containing protein [Thermomicrobiales bacterium]
MGQRPPHLEIGQISPVLTTPLTLGRADSGGLQLVIFERGHWCSSCLRHLDGLDREAGRLAELGANLQVITHEAPSAVRFHPFPVLADTDLSVGHAFGIVAADEFGYVTLRPTTLLVDQAGTILFSYVGDDSRDRPTAQEIVLVLERLSHHPDSDS